VFSDSNSDRFYQALYRKILDPGLVASSKQALFLNLLYKSMKRDEAERRVRVMYTPIDSGAHTHTHTHTRKYLLVSHTHAHTRTHILDLVVCEKVINL